MDFGRFLDIVRAFEAAEVDYVLVGGVAVNLHGIVRATEDVDFFVRPGAENVERLKRALRSLWDDPEIEQIRAEDFESYPTLIYYILESSRQARIPGGSRSRGRMAAAGAEAPCATGPRRELRRLCDANPGSTLLRSVRARRGIVAPLGARLHRRVAPFRGRARRYCRAGARPGSVGCGRQPALGYGPPGDDLVIDVLTRLGTAFAFDDIESESITVEGVRVRVATPATLVRMKPDANEAGDDPSHRQGRCRGPGAAVPHRGRLMPVQRFRDFDEARRALWVERGDPALPRRIRRLWAFAARLAPGTAPRGVRRFRTLEEANSDREAWSERRARELREQRRRP